MSDDQTFYPLPTEPPEPHELPLRMRTLEQQAQVRAACGDARVQQEQQHEQLFSRLWEGDDEQEPTPDFMQRLLSRVEQDRQGMLTQAALKNALPIPHSSASSDKPALRGFSVASTEASVAAGAHNTSMDETSAPPVEQVLKPMQGVADRMSTAEAGPSSRRGALTGVRAWAQRMPRAVPLAALSAMLLLLLVMPGQKSSLSLDDNLRTRGQEKVPMELLMEAVAELPDGALQPVKTGGMLPEQAGLVFQFQAAGGRKLTLVEQTPDGQVNLLLTREPLEGSTRLETVHILDESGRALKYTPDHGPGTYTFFGVLSQEPVALTDELREALHAVRDGHGSPTLDRNPWRIEMLKVRFEHTSPGGVGNPL
ncbi:MAG: hypothetical protein ACKO6N_02355 [Myxococcota bacterium]